MANPPSAQDVADALAMTLEREDAAGAPWCPPGDGVALRRWVTDRSASLGTGIRRAVRLARVMAVVDGRDYVRFLYCRLTSLRARLFRSAIEEAMAQGRIAKSFATLSDHGVHLRDPTLAPQGATHEVFEIDFVQMPRLAALLDFIHNAIGFATVADLLAPLLQGTKPARHADEVARSLQSALNAWLSDRLESQNHILQAQRMRAFLATHGGVTPGAIDDNAILSFWTTLAEAPEDERIDGFRLYRSAASAMLRYRHALRDATTARHLEDAIASGMEPANDNLTSGGNEANAETSFEPWRSPLRALATPPADRVKWLTKKEQHGLLNYLGGPAEEEGDGEEPEGDDQPDTWKGSLVGDERFDLAFWLTLLRADVFGAVQASIVARLRKRATGEAAIAQAMEQVDEAAYLTAAAGYSQLRQQLHLESLAALAVLMEAGAPEAVILMDFLGGPPAVTSIIGSIARKGIPESGEETVAEDLSRTIAPALKAAIGDPNALPAEAGRHLVQEALAARKKVSRIGFRRDDWADPNMVAALRSGAIAVFEVIRELDRLAAVLSHKAPAGDVSSDSARFHATFQRIYRDTSSS
jgi:hypothetical protein